METEKRKARPHPPNPLRRQSSRGRPKLGQSTAATSPAQQPNIILQPIVVHMRRGGRNDNGDDGRLQEH
eukprot:4660316-Pyramimonas_sp.AAC.1